MVLETILEQSWIIFKIFFLDPRVIIPSLIIALILGIIHYKIETNKNKEKLMPLEELKDELREFEIYKKMILNGEAGDRNTIVQHKDGTCAIIHHITKTFPVPDMKISIDEIERITVFINGHEFEFVSCQ